MVQAIQQSSVENVTETLEFRNDRMRLRFASDPRRRDQPVESSYSFEFCRKEARFGEVIVDQFWLDKRLLYGQRNSSPRNLHAIVDAFWSNCRRLNATDDRGSQESYLLAKLLPSVRSNGSKKILLDSIIESSNASAAEDAAIRELEECLRLSEIDELELEDFYTQTQAFLSPEENIPEAWDEYSEMKERLLGVSCDTLRRDTAAAISAAEAEWDRWYRSISRRKGHEKTKQVLDVFSYEARAAFHRCYSSVWVELLPLLAARFEWSQETAVFHALWHLDLCMPSEIDASLFHFFHGHIFGLHPAGATFSQTYRGGELIADAIRSNRVYAMLHKLLSGEPVSRADIVPEFRRLLSGLLIAVCSYSNQHETKAESRKCGPKLLSENDLELASNEQITRSGRRKGRQPKND